MLLSELMNIFYITYECTYVYVVECSSCLITFVLYLLSDSLHACHQRQYCAPEGQTTRHTECVRRKRGRSAELKTFHGGYYHVGSDESPRQPNVTMVCHQQIQYFMLDLINVQLTKSTSS